MISRLNIGKTSPAVHNFRPLRKVHSQQFSLFCALAARIHSLFRESKKHTNPNRWQLILRNSCGHKTDLWIREAENEEQYQAFNRYATFRRNAAFPEHESIFMFKNVQDLCGFIKEDNMKSGLPAGLFSSKSFNLGGTLRSVGIARFKGSSGAVHRRLDHLRYTQRYGLYIDRMLPIFDRGIEGGDFDELELVDLHPEVAKTLSIATYKELPGPFRPVNDPRGRHFCPKFKNDCVAIWKTLLKQDKSPGFPHRPPSTLEALLSIPSATCISKTRTSMQISIVQFILFRNRATRPFRRLGEKS